MPYGMKGGDTPESDAKMERCVNQVMAGGKRTKEQAIRLCKSSIQKGDAYADGN